jgi:hypothetical protein
MYNCRSTVSSTIVAVLFQVKVRGDAIKVRGDAIKVRGKLSEPCALWRELTVEWRSSVAKGGSWRVTAMRLSDSGIDCFCGRIEANLILGWQNGMRMLDFEILRCRGIGRSCRVVCKAEGGEALRNQLVSIIKNNQRILESQLGLMAEGELESKLALTKP